MSTVSNKEIRMIQNRLNNRPRKRLGFKTPAEVFHQSDKFKQRNKCMIGALSRAKRVGGESHSNDQCVHRQRFETLQHASRVLGDWIGFYNQKRPHQALRMKTPNQAFEIFKLAA